jgi:DNA-binding CsgD family transcriptional regulator/PAS domain-containing protein
MTAMRESSARVLDLVYDAAADDTLWTEALAGIASLTRSNCCIIYGMVAYSNLIHFRHSFGQADESHRAFVERHADNPFSRHMLVQPEGRIVRSEEFISLGELKKRDFFHDVLAPSDTGYGLFSPILSRGNFRVAFNLLRSPRQSPHDEDAVSALAELAPHLRRSFLLRFRNDAYAELQRGAYDALDRMAMGVFLIDQAGKIVYANAAACALGQADGPLRLFGSRLAAEDTDASSRLTRLVGEAINGAPLAGMLLADPAKDRYLCVSVSSTRSRDIDRLQGHGELPIAAIVYVSDPMAGSRVQLDWLCNVYGLTSAEARIALSVTLGQSTTTTARDFGISPNTVKTHLRNVFAKTRVASQAQLAMLLTSIGNLGGAGMPLE